MEAHPVYELSSVIVDELARTFPNVATEVGVAGFDDQWTDLSPDGAVDAARTFRGLMSRVEELPSAATDWDRVAVELARETLTEELGKIEHGDHLRDLNSMASSLQSLREIWDHMGRDSDAEWLDIVARLERLPEALAGYRASLDEGRRREMAVARRQVEAALEQCRVSASDSSRLTRLVVEHSQSGLAVGLGSQLEQAVGAARAAFDEFAAYLSGVYMADAPDRDGVGQERYVRAAYEFLGTNIDPVETYEWGWEQVADLEALMSATAAEITPGATSAEVSELLRTDPERTVATPGALALFIQERLDQALDSLAGVHFDVPEQVREVTVNIAPPGSSLGAYYVGPSEDFSRPGSVWWSLTPDGPYPLYDEVSTAYHEGFPGHHLQVGVQMSLAEHLSRLHRLWVWKPGAGEGWALYAERLMNELGYLEKPDYVFGWLTGQMLRACRVVIDIGSHLELPIPTQQSFRPGEAWSFGAAVEMLEQFSLINREYAASETTRYLGWPGQAISYKVGEQAILDIRSQAQAQAGPAFDPKAFHARLLEVGPVGLDLLRSELIR